MAEKKTNQATMFLALSAIVGPKKAVDWYIIMMTIALGFWFYAMFIMD